MRTANKIENPTWEGLKELKDELELLEIHSELQTRNGKPILKTDIGNIIIFQNSNDFRLFQTDYMGVEIKTTFVDIDQILSFFDSNYGEEA